MALGSDSFAYDQANRLTSATVGGATSTYAYDGDGKRVSSTVGGTTTRAVYDVNAGLPVLLDDGTRKYVFGLGLAYAVPSSGGVEVYHTDGLGSVRAITNSAGTVVQTDQTDEFGIPTQTSGSSGQPFGYTGEQRDGETGFVFLRARLYDPAVGRFVQRDPVPGAVADPASLNRYAYGANNPLRYSDPSGLVRVELFHRPVHTGRDEERDVTFESPYLHTYIVVTALSGEQHVYAAYPTYNPPIPGDYFGPISASRLLLGDSVEKDQKRYAPRVLVDNNEPAGPYLARLDEYTAAVTAARIAYWPTGSTGGNSNSYAYEAIEFLLGYRPTPPWYVWVPSWDNRLVLPARGGVKGES